MFLFTKCTNRTSQNRLLAFASLCLFALLANQSVAQEFMPGIKWPEPEAVQPGETNDKPPADAIVLFDGKDMSAWKGAENWKVKEGIATSGKGNIYTKQSFGDCQLHIEWSSPIDDSKHGQDRGNSGVFFMSTYEIQVLDSYKSKTYPEGQAGAVYKQTPPMVNAMRPPGEWNTYEIIWTAPRFNEDGSLKSPAYITAIHNGILVQNHFELHGDTAYHHLHSYKKHAAKLPLRLQDHGSPVRFRNIWLREFKPIVGKRITEPYMLNHRTGKKTPVSELKKKN